MTTNFLPSGLPRTAENVAHELENEWSRFVRFTINCDVQTIESGVARLAAIRRMDLGCDAHLRPATISGLRFWMGW